MSSAGGAPIVGGIKACQTHHTRHTWNILSNLNVILNNVIFIPKGWLCCRQSLFYNVYSSQIDRENEMYKSANGFPQQGIGVIAPPVSHRRANHRWLARRCFAIIAYLETNPSHWLIILYRYFTPIPRSFDGESGFNIVLYWVLCSLKCLVLWSITIITTDFICWLGDLFEFRSRRSVFTDRLWKSMRAHFWVI